ncbi:unnamed protein product [Staurois parvus]|uniref:Uncharacterized protein n=1 Tax=Staurois parvus TaxID=386267 RepID=A0ABN9AQ21_9NEOB|nr:unnamed protein product [Staurois parvus]
MLGVLHVWMLLHYIRIVFHILEWYQCFSTFFQSRHPLKLWTVLRHPILNCEDLF